MLLDPTSRRLALARSLLQLKDEPLSDAQVSMSTAVCDTILKDMAGLIAGAIKKRGAGLPVQGLDGEVRWFTPDEIRARLAMAEADHDLLMAPVFRDCLHAIEKIDERTVFFALASPQGFRIFPLDTDDPAAGVRELLEHWGR